MSCPFDDEDFQIDSDVKADWAVRKIAEIRKERDRLIAATEAVIEEYQEKIDKLKERAEAESAYFTGELLRYFDAVPHRETKTQASYDLPSGKLVLKRKQPEIKRNADELLPFAKSLGAGFVKITEAPAWEDIKKLCDVTSAGCVLKSTGELVPGVTVTPRPDEFEIEVNVNV